jgi:hypothetical protein
VAILQSGILSRVSGRLAGLSIVKRANGTIRLITRKHADRNSPAQQLVRARFKLTVTVLSAVNEMIIAPYSQYGGRRRTAWDYAVRHSMLYKPLYSWYYPVSILSGTLPKNNAWWMHFNLHPRYALIDWEGMVNPGYEPDDLLFFVAYMDNPPFVRVLVPGVTWSTGYYVLTGHPSGPDVYFTIIPVVVRPPGKWSSLISEHYAVTFYAFSGLLH